MDEIKSQLEAAVGYLDLGMTAEARAILEWFYALPIEQDVLLPLWFRLLFQEGDAEEALSIARHMRTEFPADSRWRVALADIVRFGTDGTGGQEFEKEAGAILLEAETHFPQDAEVKYALARWSARNEAVRRGATLYLRRAFALDPSLRRAARSEPDLDSIRREISDL